MFIFHRCVPVDLVELWNEIHVSLVSAVLHVFSLLLCYCYLAIYNTPCRISRTPHTAHNIHFWNQYLPYGFIVTSQQKLITVYWNPCALPTKWTYSAISTENKNENQHQIAAPEHGKQAKHVDGNGDYSFFCVCGKLWITIYRQSVSKVEEDRCHFPKPHQIINLN